MSGRPARLPLPYRCWCEPEAMVGWLSPTINIKCVNKSTPLYLVEIPANSLWISCGLCHKPRHRFRPLTGAPPPLSHEGRRSDVVPSPSFQRKLESSGWSALDSSFRWSDEGVWTVTLLASPSLGVIRRLDRRIHVAPARGRREGPSGQAGGWRLGGRAYRSWGGWP